MPKQINRRDFVLTGAGVATAALASRPAFAQSPTMMVRRSVKPVVVASGNGNRYKNQGPVTCVEKAFQMITAGSDVLDSVIAGVNINELDPEETGVGYGGHPNANGILQLDASVMHGPRKRAGAVASLEGVKTPSLVAQKVADLTDHHLLVGRDAQAFARMMGFTIEDDLNTPASRQRWLEWKRRTDPSHYPTEEMRQSASLNVINDMIRDGILEAEHAFGTINCNGINAKGEICGVTTTCGLAFKIPGRVGDSPILGAGLYVDGDVGAAGSTGRGEANLYNLTSFLIVDLMRRGMHPKDAGMEGLKRIKDQTIEKRLLNSRGLPNFGVSFYIINAKGEYAGVSMYAGANSTYAVCTENGPQSVPIDGLLEGQSGQ